MRRKDKEISEQKDLDAVLKKAQVCRLGLSCNNMAYIVPMCFGYADRILYFHSGEAGLKLEILRENPLVCFEVEADVQLRPGSDLDCDWSMSYRSVIGFGEVVFIEDGEEKRKALQIIKQQYSDQFRLAEGTQLVGVTVFMVVVKTMTGKKSGWQF